MGTRADFYVGLNENMEWIGSFAWDGHHDTVMDRYPEMVNAGDEATFRTEVEKLLKGRDDGTLPEQGWPWPWEDSGTTDVTYAFHDSSVWATGFGDRFRKIIDIAEQEEKVKSIDDYDVVEKMDEAFWKEGIEVKFPNMKHLKNTARPGSQRSGVMLFTAKR